MMLSLLSAIVVAASSAAAAPATHVSKVNRAAITYVVNEHYGGHVRIHSIVASGDFALVWGSRRGASFYDGLTLRTSGWRIGCTMGQIPPSAAQLERSCGFPTSAATQLAEEQNANVAATQGNFGLAVIAEVRAHNAVQHASAFQQAQERGRLQLLQRLKMQMQLGQITRSQAIQRWNEFQIYF